MATSNESRGETPGGWQSEESGRTSWWQTSKGVAGSPPSGGGSGLAGSRGFPIHVLRSADGDQRACLGRYLKSQAVLLAGKALEGKRSPLFADGAFGQSSTSGVAKKPRKEQVSREIWRQEEGNP